MARKSGFVRGKTSQAPDAPAPPPLSRQLASPVFAQPEPTPDPTVFKVKHPSDSPAYKIIDRLNAEHRIQAMPFPSPRGGQEPSLTLQEVFGDNAGAIKSIRQRNQIVFHATGDCGSTRGPKTQNEVTDKMIGDFNETDPKEVPQFCFLLGDIVYNFGETGYYYDQFYDPYRDYPAPILAAAGNHDGMISPLAHAKSLEAYLRNFCSDPADGYTVTPEAGGLSRTAQIQPGVFFTFDAPFVRFLVVYSNTLEDPGVIANPTIGDAQLKYLQAALQRIKAEKYEGAIVFAHHHPPYAVGAQHASSTAMRRQMDAICNQTGVWPHAVLSGHAHNYQRFTRLRSDGTEIPYIICGNGGHNVQKLGPKGNAALRAPQIVQAKTGHEDRVVLENYDDMNYGYLRIIANSAQLRIEYHPASDGSQTKAPDDSVTINLASRRQASYVPNDLGFPAQAETVRQLHDRQKNSPHPRPRRKRSSAKRAPQTKAAGRNLR